MNRAGFASGVSLDADERNEGSLGVLTDILGRLSPIAQTRHLDWRLFDPNWQVSYRRIALLATVFGEFKPHAIVDGIAIA